MTTRTLTCALWCGRLQADTSQIALVLYKYNTPTNVWALNTQGYEPLQALETHDGYPCLHQPMIVACRCLLVAPRGIASACIPVHLQQTCHQLLALGCQTLGFVGSGQDVQAFGDVALGQSF